MTSQIALGAKPAHLPLILRNRTSPLVLEGMKVIDLKEMNPSNSAAWRPAHQQWELKIKKACPSYRRLQGQSFGTLCNSGRVGQPTRGHKCGQCQFFASTNDTKATLSQIETLVQIQPAANKAHRARVVAAAYQPAAKKIEAPLPVVNMVPVQQHSATFAQLAAQADCVVPVQAYSVPPGVCMVESKEYSFKTEAEADAFVAEHVQAQASRIIEMPQPVAQDEIVSMLHFHEILENISLLQDARRGAKSVDKTIIYSDRISNQVIEACKIASMFPAGKMAEMYTQLSSINL